MSIFVTGDTHGTLDIGKVTDYFEDKKDLNENDYLIICGDVGVCGFLRENEHKTREILKSLPVTVLFIDGNHEHHPRLNAYPEDEWRGGRVHMIEPGIIHLMRGQVFNIAGTTIFTFGGADSVDKEMRRAGIDWFAEEMPTTAEYEEGLRNLEKLDYKVDFIVTHSAPREVAAYLGYGEKSDGEIILRRYFQQIADEAEFKTWFFGHFHEDAEVEGVFRCLYDDVVQIV